MFVNKPLERGRSHIPASFNENKPLIQTSNNRKVSGEVKGHASKIIKNVPNHVNIQDNKKQMLCSDNIRNVNVTENKFDYDKDNYCCEETKKEQQVLNSILGYASSQSELSAPYIKLSDE